MGVTSAGDRRARRALPRHHVLARAASAPPACRSTKHAASTTTSIRSPPRCATAASSARRSAASRSAAWRRCASRRGSRTHVGARPGVDAGTAVAPQAAPPGLPAAPWLFGPLFLAETPLRLRPEMRAALPSLRDRAAFGVGQAAKLLTARRCRVAAWRSARRLLRSLDVERRLRARRPRRRWSSPASARSITSCRSTARERYAQLIAGAQLRRARADRTPRLRSRGRRRSPRIVHEFLSRRQHAAA